MRNSHNITLTNSESLTEDEETTWSLSGAVVGFVSSAVRAGDTDVDLWL